MRDVGRIDIICDKIKQYWHSVPDWRFLQLVNNLIRYISNGDGFYVEDDVFESKLDEFFAHVFDKINFDEV